MDIEKRVKSKLLMRGFSKETLLNNRGLIGATTDETILELVKNLGLGGVSQQRELLIAFYEFLQANYTHELFDSEKIQVINKFEAINCG